MSQELVQQGTSVMTLTDLVRKYLIGRGDVKFRAMIQTLVLAQAAYDELFRTTLWEPRRVPITVTSDNTITVPDDCEQVVNICVVDALGKLQVLTLNPYWNTVQTVCSDGSCSCSSCGGNDTLCETLDAITATVTQIQIGETSYLQTTWIKNNCGNIQKAVKTPYWDTELGEVVYDTQYSTICTVETTSEGCIKYTAANVSLLRSYLGGWFNWGFLYNYAPLRELIPATPNNYGEWNYNAADKKIIHIFRPKNRIQPATESFYNPYLQKDETVQSDITQVILIYRPNGDAPGAEILVPKYAQKAMEAYMMYDTERLSPRATERGVEMKLRNYRRERTGILKRLYPIREADIALLQTQQKKW